MYVCLFRTVFEISSKIPVSAIPSKKKKKTVYVHVSTLNGFWDRDISLYSSKTVAKKEILRTGIYCSSDKVGTVCLVQYIFENFTVNINALCNSCEDMACCSSKYPSTDIQTTAQWNNSISETVRNRTHVRTYSYTFLLIMINTMSSQNSDLSSHNTLYIYPRSIIIIIIIINVYVCMYVYCPFSPQNDTTIGNVLILFFSPVNANYIFSWNYY
jgi:hypothetical protein